MTKAASQNQSWPIFDEEDIFGDKIGELAQSLEASETEAVMAPTGDEADDIILFEDIEEEGPQGHTEEAWQEYIQCQSDYFPDDYNEEVCELLDPDGAYWLCFEEEYCEEIVNEYWYDCFWYHEECDKYLGDSDEHNEFDDIPSDEGADTVHDGKPGERFQDWLDCYKESYEPCDSYSKHAEFHECFWYGDECEDPFWHDCHWYGDAEDDCATVLNDHGYESGYETGYNDAIVDHFPQMRDADMPPFQYELLVQSFESWIKEQEQRRSMFHCGLDVRLDLPFDDSEYTAIWAAQDCSDWDLYLTLVLPNHTVDLAIARDGAELSERRGCYWIDNSQEIRACEFYLPHGGDNFGILFAGGFHGVWYEYEWEYNPGWESWFGG